MITIVTPTYNRAHLLPRLRESLCAQTCKDFEWLVIDDGSTDGTEEMFRNGNVDGNDNVGFPVRYIRKENGGKHTALNVAFREVTTELLFIVDSDDTLTSDAIETITADWTSVRGEGLCGISYLRGYSETKHIGDKHPRDGERDTFINMRFNRGIDGDKAEVWATAYLRDYQYPEYHGERFISESVAWIYLAHSHKMLFRNKILYITEYLEGGLSLTGRRLRFQCPNGMAYGSLETMTPEFLLKIRIKEALLYIVYSKFGGKSLREILRCRYKGLVAVCYVPGVMLYWHWKRKYMD